MCVDLDQECPSVNLLNLELINDGCMVNKLKAYEGNIFDDDAGDNDDDAGEDL